MNIKKIKFITDDTNIELNNYLMDLTPNSKGIFYNYRFYFNEDIKDYDYLVIFETLPKKLNVKVAKENTIYVAGEATSIKKYNQKFLDQFGHIITCQNRIHHKSKFLKSPGHTWFSKKTYDELMNMKNVKKTKLLSIVVSNKVFTQGHRDRLKFCLKLKEKLGDKVDLFGRGFKDFEDKWDVIAPYKYSIAIENSIEDHWITEKLGDCYTSHTFPFYMGAPNVNSYYNSNSYNLIDITNFDKSLKIIENILNDKEHYSRHLNYLIDAKYDYINKHSMIPMICTFIDSVKITNRNNKISTTIYPNKNSLIQKIYNKISMYIKRFK